MPAVYWIHLPEHSDITKEGYVGYSSRDPAVRYLEHVADSRCKTSKSEILKRAIIKYGDKLICRTLVEGSEEYCLLIENKLRPTRQLGWNIAIGGGKPPSWLGKKQSEQTIQEKSLRLQGIAPPNCDKVKAKRAKTRHDKGIWNYSPSEIKTSYWRNADSIKYYSDMVPVVNYKNLSEVLDLEYTPYLHEVVRYIKDNNFDPSNDERWCRDFKSNDLNTVQKAIDNYKKPAEGIPQKSSSVKLRINSSKIKIWNKNPSWKLAEEIYSMYVSYGKRGKEISCTLNITEDSFTCMIKRFKTGWIPSEDFAYLNWLEESKGTT